MNPLPFVPDYRLRELICSFRGQQVMIDADPATLYGVERKVLNQAVKRNICRFPESFRFRLSAAEKIKLVTSCDRFSNLKHSGTYPCAFAGQGVAMLAGVLRSQTAIQTRISIISAFVEMRRCITERGGLLQRLDALEQRQSRHESIADARFNKIFDALEQKSLSPTQGIFFDGRIFDAYDFVNDLLREAKRSIVLIDNYVDDTVLVQLSKRRADVTATILTRSIGKQLALDLKKHNAQFPPIAIREFPVSHDRFLILDGKSVYHIGASLKDMGKKWFAFSRMQKGAHAVMVRVEELLDDVPAGGTLQ
ncbi:MAG: ORF6N domain-containing protein [Chlorobiaceae bacterium]